MFRGGFADGAPEPSHPARWEPVFPGTAGSPPPLGWDPLPACYPARAGRSDVVKHRRVPAGSLLPVMSTAHAASTSLKAGHRAHRSLTSSRQVLRSGSRQKSRYGGYGVFRRSASTFNALLPKNYLQATTAHRAVRTGMNFIRRCQTFDCLHELTPTIISMA